VSLVVLKFCAETTPVVTRKKMIAMANTAIGLFPEATAPNPFDIT
jgi:hypothetical protein